jgi:hypothetical protein
MPLPENDRVPGSGTRDSDKTASSTTGTIEDTPVRYPTWRLSWRNCNGRAGAARLIDEDLALSLARQIAACPEVDDVRLQQIDINAPFHEVAGWRS